MRNLTGTLTVFLALVMGDVALAGKLVNAGKRRALCTQQYAPVCALVRKDCVQAAPCPEVRRTFPNACMARLAGGRILHKGRCRPIGPGTPEKKNGCRNDDLPPEKDPACKAWTDGCNICQREKPGAPATCTDITCNTRGPALCLKHF